MYIQEQEKPMPVKKSGGAFTVLTSSIVGAVIGGMLTIYGAPVLEQSGLLPGFFKQTTAQLNQVQQNQTQPAQETPKAEVQQTAAAATDLISAINQVKPAVVGVVNMQKASSFYQESSSDKDSGTGSGVVFKISGNEAYIVTNNHVVEGADKIEVALTDGKRVSAQIVGADSLTDLAVIKMDSKYAAKAASFGDSSKLQTGEQVVAIGNPLGLDLSSTVTQGIVSGTGRSIPVSTSAGQWDMNVIQTDAAINPGNSGGALINSAGQVVGINSMKISETGVEGLGFAIPSADVVPIVEKLMTSGKVERPYIGVGLKNLSELTQYIQSGELVVPSSLEKGIVITSVEGSSPGAQAGLKAKDVIVSIDNTAVGTVTDLRKYLYTKTTSGKAVTLGIYRDGKQMSLSLTPQMK
ncbi:S1C family serine protease [Ectobacillus ponti]|uniref:Trypsin-like peptidase domain-containing protein n=1 Tax=Ectobacillus ponti TaxID=2961894 RepID=A0AA41X6Z4_9BACI|nr:trypsin-like peptidase domain-containing protein [Ectobacillus ponti]MCP8969977.1 trypsin-like peptidase domain-containing protein [Ectobacillus ponti]